MMRPKIPLKVVLLLQVLWTDLPCPHYHLLICVALLDNEKQALMEPECGFTEILKVCYLCVLYTDSSAHH